MAMQTKGESLKGELPKDELLFAAKVREWIRSAENGRPALSPFLDETKQIQARELLRGTDEACVSRFFGGYVNAERCRLVIAPDEMAAERAAARAVESVLLRGSGYAALTHRDFLGALMAAGVTRESVGDIVVRESREAVIFAIPSVCAFLCSDPSPLDRVGRDKVIAMPFQVEPGFCVERQFLERCTTVPSPRLDAIVSGLTNLSREKAAALVRNGGTAVNGRPQLRTDALLSEGDVLSVTGYGKYRIEQVHEKTRKDRIRLLALQYV